MALVSSLSSEKVQSSVKNSDEPAGYFFDGLRNLFEGFLPYPHLHQMYPPGGVDERVSLNGEGLLRNIILTPATCYDVVLPQFYEVHTFIIIALFLHYGRLQILVWPKDCKSGFGSRLRGWG